jgi:hypothetical protein
MRATTDNAVYHVNVGIHPGGVSKTEIRGRPGYKKFLTLNTTAAIADQTTTVV